MSNAVCGPCVPPSRFSEGAVDDSEAPSSPCETAEACDESCDSTPEAWSPFAGEAQKSDVLVPCNSPVDSGVVLADSWGFEDFPESTASPTTPSVLSAAAEPPKKNFIGPLFFPVDMATSSASGHFLATAFAQQTGRSWTGALTVHDISGEPTLLSSCALTTTPSFVALNNDCATSLLVALDDGCLLQMEVSNSDRPTVTQVRSEHDAPISSFAVSRGRTRAFSCDLTGCLCVWDPMMALENLLTRPSRTLLPSDIVVAPHPILERRFVSAGTNTVRLWQEEEEVACFALAKASRPGASISCVHWREENFLLIGWFDGTVQLVDIRQHEHPLWSVGGGLHGREILSLCTTPSGATVTISADNYLRVMKDGAEATEKWGLRGGSVWDSRCEEKLVTAMVPLPGSETAVLACCRDQSFWRWHEGADAVESVSLPLNPSDSDM